MCYGDTITIEVKAINHGIVDLNNATQVIEAATVYEAVVEFEEDYPGQDLAKLLEAGLCDFPGVFEDKNVVDRYFEVSEVEPLSQDPLAENSEGE